MVDSRLAKLENELKDLELVMEKSDWVPRNAKGEKRTYKSIRKSVYRFVKSLSH